MKITDGNITLPEGNGIGFVKNQGNSYPRSHPIIIDLFF